MTSSTTSGTSIAAEERWARERRESPRWWWGSLIGPPLSAVVIVAVLAGVMGVEYARGVVARALLSFFLIGRFVIMEPTTAMSAEALLALVLYMDLAAGIFCASHAAVLFRLPWVGRRLSVLVDDSETIADSEGWTRRALFAALVLFVAMPLTATGSVGGAVLGRLLGLGRALTIPAVVVGSLLTSSVMYSGAAAVRRWVQPDDPLLKWLGVATLVVVLGFLGSRYRAAVRRRARRSRK
jgi:uncharacterized membrane protein